MKRSIISVILAASFLSGVGIASFYQKNIVKPILVAGAGSALGGGLVWFIFDTKLIHERNGFKAKISTLKTDSEVQIKTLKTQTEQQALAIADIEKTNTLSTRQLNEARKTLKIMMTILASIDVGTEEYNLEVNRLNNKISHLEKNLQDVSAQREEFRNVAEFKEQEILAFENTFHEKLEKTYQEKVQQEVEAETNRQFALLEESEQILAEMDRFVKEVYQRHQSQRHYTLDVNEKFFDYKKTADAKSQQAFDDLFNEKLGLEVSNELLTRKLNDGLTHPVYGEYGLTSIEGRNINGLVEWVFRNLQIPLKALRFDEHDGIVSFGLDYQKTADVSIICDTLKEHGDTLKKYLGIHALTRIEYLPKYDAIAVSYRQHAPTPIKDEDIYKDGLIPARDFCDSIFKASDHTTQGKPTLRIMAATGEGKGIVTKNLVAYFAQLPEWEVWVSDPLHGSEQDFWDCAKVATSPKTSGQAYKKFAELHEDRQNKTAGITDRQLVAIFDEFDKQHGDSDKVSAQKIMTAIRHTRQRQILIGQTAEVGANGWTWDDMKQCALLVLGDSIGTLCKHLVKDLGWTLKKSNDVKRQYEKFSEWAEKKNTSNPDLPSENCTRIGLLVVSGRFQFLELPIPHKGIIRSGEGIIRESFISQSDKVAIKSEPELAPTESKKVTCPKCGSDATKNGFPRYKCKNVECQNRFKI